MSLVHHVVKKLAQMQRIPGLYFKPTKSRGRGVFCSHDIPANSLIESCPIIVIPESEKDQVHNTVLHDYYFDWKADSSQAAIALGFGSLYNHSSDPNALYQMNFEMNLIDIIALKDIPLGEEILIDYNSGDSDKLWFTIN